MLVERVGAGGMAEVFRAKVFGMAGFEKTVAVKRILPERAQDEGFVEMFVREANIAVRLTHSNIVQVLELGRFANDFYIALEYVEGKDLKSVIRAAEATGRPIPPPIAAFIAQKICLGLHHAHQALGDDGRSLGIVHRDVSPHNVLVSWSGEVKVADFGIAKLQSHARHTRTGMIKGKTAYMSPEQSLGDPGLDARSDVFAVGIVLHELLTGQRPFEGATDLDILRRIREHEPPPPSRVSGRPPDDLDGVVAAALAKRREDRYADAASMGRALGAYLQRAGEQHVVDDADVSALVRELFDARAPIVAPREPTPMMRDGANTQAGTAAVATPVGVEPEGDGETVVFARWPLADPHAETVAPRRPRPSREAQREGELAANQTIREVRRPRASLASQPAAIAPPIAEIAETTIAPPPVAKSPIAAWIAGGLLAFGGGAAIIVALSSALSSALSPGEPPTATPVRTLSTATPWTTPVPVAAPSPAASLAIESATPRPAATRVGVARTPGRVLVDGSPAGASVSIDGGKLSGKLGAPIAGLQPGEHSVTVSAEFHRALTKSVTIAPGETSPLHVELERGKGTLRIAGPRAPYRVTIAGVIKRESTWSLPAGRHQAVVDDGRRQATVTVEIHDGLQTSMVLAEPLEDGLIYVPE